jgi:WASH complex subunit strumpellin
MLDNMYDSLNPVEHVVASPWRFYHQQHLSRASRALGTLQDALLNLGQLQLIRKQLAYQMSLSAGFDAKLLNSALKTFNQ